MAKYRVYNEGCYRDDVSPTRSVEDLPPRLLQDVLRQVLAALGNERRMEEYLTYARGPVEGLEELLGDAAVVEIVDRWAVEESFDPEKVGAREAAWLVVAEDGRQEVRVTRLEQSSQSPNGLEWVTTDYAYVEARPGSGKPAYWKACWTTGQWDRADVEDFRPTAFAREVIDVPVEYMKQLGCDEWAHFAAKLGDAAEYQEAKGLGAPRPATDAEIKHYRDKTHPGGRGDLRIRAEAGSPPTPAQDRAACAGAPRAPSASLARQAPARA